MDIKEYVEMHGYKVSDLTEEEMKKVEAEVNDVNNGLGVLHSVLAPMGEVQMRMDSY